VKSLKIVPLLTNYVILLLVIDINIHYLLLAVNYYTNRTNNELFELLGVLFFVKKEKFFFIK